MVWYASTIIEMTCHENASLIEVIKSFVYVVTCHENASLIEVIDIYSNTNDLS